MRLLCAELGHPQRSYDSLHVVGTNGKSSVTTMCAAMLSVSGLRSGACISPHAWRWSERTRIDGVEVGDEAFAAAVEEVARAITSVQAGLGEDERITQFEAAIAASFVILARAEVDVAVVEAGLGGRLDATNVIPSRATALTTVGLDHVEWLGRTELKIAAEKLSVLQPGTALVIGELAPEVAALAHRVAVERDATVVVAEPVPSELMPGNLAPFLARNAGVAVALAAVVSGNLAADEIAAGLAAARLPGRAELLGGDPPLLADAAHNEQGARALAEALPALAGGRPVIACLSILADKDCPAIITALAPALAGAVCTAAEPGPAIGRPGAHAESPEELRRLLTAAGVESEVVRDPEGAVGRALGLARDRSGVALCAGSHYLLRYAWTARHAQNFSR